MRLAAALLVILAGCSEDDRRAWVSILPLPEDEPAEPVAVDTTGGTLALAADSTAVLLGSDTLFTLDRLPARGPGAAPLLPARLHAIAFSPDSARVAFTTAGANEAVGVWSRPRQVVSIADAFPAGRADSIAWSADGRFLAYQGRTAEGLTRAGIYDAGIGTTLRHPVLGWLARNARSVRVQGWPGEGRATRLRLLVATGPPAAGGRAYLWDPVDGSLTVEAHIQPLAANAPEGGRLQRGGVFSVDLLGDGAPETVALYRTAEGAPGALVLESRGQEFRAYPRQPLLPPQVVGFEEWSEARAGPLLHMIAPLGGATTVLLKIPSNDASLDAIGLFQAREGAGLVPLMATTPRGDVPAIFYDGRSPGGTVQLGLVDLDDDGGLEVISAIGRPAAGAPQPSVSWGATVYRWSAGRLVPAPELEGRALERIARATSGGGRGE